MAIPLPAQQGRDSRRIPILFDLDATISGFIDLIEQRRNRTKRQSYQEPCGVTPARLFAVRCSSRQGFVSLPIEVWL
jgi:hypothetical protein